MTARNLLLQARPEYPEGLGPRHELALALLIGAYGALRTGVWRGRNILVCSSD